jgi:hypothetical protein
MFLLQSLSDLMAQGATAEELNAIRAAIVQSRSNYWTAINKVLHDDAVFEKVVLLLPAVFVSLLMWAGGDVRSLGPCLYKEYTTDPECYTTGLTEACYSGKVDLIKKLKPDPALDNLPELLHHLALFGTKDALLYLLELGADPNEKPNGGSSALDAALWRLDPGPIGLDGFSLSRVSAWEALENIGLLLAHGAIWNPEPYQMNSLRKSLMAHDTSVTVDLLQLFRKHSSCPAALIHKLIGTPKMREHLASQSWKLDRLGLKGFSTR